MWSEIRIHICGFDVASPVVSTVKVRLKYIWTLDLGLIFGNFRSAHLCAFILEFKLPK
jgi:hypothetical protein